MASKSIDRLLDLIDRALEEADSPAARYARGEVFDFHSQTWTACPGCGKPEVFTNPDGSVTYGRCPSCLGVSNV